MSRRRKPSAAPQSITPRVAQPAAVSPPSEYAFKTEGVIRASMQALAYADSRNKVNLPDIGYAGYSSPGYSGNPPGRPPANLYRQQTVPQIDPWLAPRVSNWFNYPDVVRRQTFPNASFENLQFSTVDPYRAMRALPRLSAIVGQSLRLLKRLGNTQLIVDVKNPDASGKFTVEDKEAIAYLTGLYAKSGMQVVSRIPGALSSGAPQLTDDFFTHQQVFGGISYELVLKANRRDYSHLISVDPTTIELRRDKLNLGAYLIGQKRMDVPYGWIELNPDLVGYLATTGTGLGNPYGDPDNINAFHVAPIWQGYFGKLAIYIQRAAFGFLDAVVKVEVLQNMWQVVPPDVRQYFANDFLVWANAMTKYLADTYKAMGEQDPDQLLVHLDLMEIHGESSGKATFPTEDAAHVVRTEMYNALGVPGELMGEKATPSDRFTDLKIEAYKGTITHYQDSALWAYNRAGTAALWAKGWPRKYQVQCRFAPVQIYDRLTLAQAEQIEQLIQRFNRDEGLISQDEMSMNLLGKPALTQHPLADEANSDTSGPSTPSRDVVAVRQNARDSERGVSAGGPAQSAAPAPRGGADKARKTNPASDNKA